MRYKYILLVVLFSLSITSFTLWADKYQIDISHSSANFTATHFLISKTKGHFKDVSGTIIFDEKDITKSKVDILIKTASIDTDNEKRDNHLRNSDFFNVGKYPEIRFTSTRIKNTKDGYVLVGNLTIKDVTKEVSFPFELNGPMTDPWGNKRFGAEANLTVNRFDYNVSWNKVIEGRGLVVGNEIKIELHIEGISAKQATN